jgi:hypothetical protein
MIVISSNGATRSGNGSPGPIRVGEEEFGRWTQRGSHDVFLTAFRLLT